MQQVFDAVNNLLERKRRPHGLRVRTYAIVPLAPQAGVIEWVEHTLPFGMYLAPRNGPKGAHERYFPDDLKHMQCRQRLDAIKHTSQSASSTQRKPVNTTQARKRKAFDEVCARFRPAFRFFFLETCADAKTWLRHRDAYTRSVAANAMVGHVQDWPVCISSLDPVGSTDVTTTSPLVAQRPSHGRAMLAQGPCHGPAKSFLLTLSFRCHARSLLPKLHQARKKHK